MANKDVVEKDKNGNVIKMQRFDAEGKLVFTHETEWKDGRIVKKTSYDKDGNMTASYDYAYDKRGNNTEGSWFVFNNGELMKAEFKYDEKDRPIEVTHLGKGSIATNKTYQTFDDKGRIIVSEYYGAWPDCAPVFTYNEYDESGFNTKSRTEDENHDLLHYEIMTPGKSGKVAEYTSYDKDGKAQYTIKYYYDEKGNRTKTERYDGEGKLYSTSI